jgi:hypothetical protein
MLLAEAGRVKRGHEANARKKGVLTGGTRAL